MEIISENFVDSLPLVESAIAGADFISFDCEFSGLQAVENSIQAFDSPELIYLKCRQSVGDFIVIQVGLACFRFNAEHDRYDCSLFSFYVFPRPIELSNGQRPLEKCSRIFTCQASSLQFLSKNGFSFDKWIHKGIGYMRPHEADALRNDLRKRHERRCEAATETPSIPDDMKPEINKILRQIFEFVQNADATSMQLPGLTGYQRKILYDLMSVKFGKQIFVESKLSQDHRDPALLLRKCATGADYDLMQAQRLQTELDEVDVAEGFSKVVRMLQKSAKPIIGHNLLLDLLHFVQDFVDDLPQSYNEFKCFLASEFPSVSFFDTKFMIHENPLKELFSNGTSLESMHERLQKHPFQLIQIGAPDAGFQTPEQSTEKFHDAAFDAFVTGKAFLALARYYIEYKKPDDESDVFPLNFKLLEPFNYRIPARNVIDIGHLYLKGADPAPDRSAVFHLRLCGDAVKWRREQIVALFSAFGPIEIYWLNDNSLFVSLMRKENAEKVLSTMKNENFILSPLAQHLEVEQNRFLNTKFGKPAGKRSISGPGNEAKKVKPTPDPVSNGKPVEQKKLFEESNDWQ